MSEEGEDPFEALDEPGEDDPFEAFGEEVFEDVSADADWEDLLDEEDTELPVENDAVVPKRSFCERCEHFAAPPELSCSHPGTTIVELVDVDHLHVTDCPVVARRRELGEYD